MQLIVALTIIVSVLTFLSGLTVWLGSEKAEKSRSLMFFLSTLFASIWAFSIIVFLTLPEHSTSVAKLMIRGIYVSPLLMVLAQVFYTGWNRKSGKILGLIYSALCVLLIAFFAINPELLYSSITLSSAGNSLTLSWNWYYLAYAVAISLMLATFIFLCYLNVKDASSKHLRTANLFYMGALIVAGVFSTIFSLILPAFGIFKLIWVGPLSLSFAVIVHFYAILRYRLIMLSNIWLRVGSYVILMSMAAMVYMIIFFAIFSLLFKVENLGTEIIIMNFIMIVIMMLILPVFNEASALMRSLISVQDINMNYIVKKLNLMATQNVKFDVLASFLAHNMHFRYVGLIIDKKVYGSERKDFKKAEIDEIAMLESSGKGIWQEISGHTKEFFKEQNIVAVAELRNAKGRPFGQILVGQPMGKVSFEKRDLAQIETVVNLVASIIDSEKRLKA